VKAGLAGTAPPTSRCDKDDTVSLGGLTMGKGLLLWLIGIPLPIILLLYFFNVF
jgi:hypothetical protein